MGPTIILDKSSFQMLSFDEIVTLHNYYSIVVTPVLILEILGDLSKNPPKDKATRDKVVYFAQKIQFGSTINMHYLSLIRASLLGYYIEMNGRPVVSQSKAIITDDGKRGVIINETPEEIALHRWREGDFTKAEEIFSSFWRKTTTKPSQLEDFKASVKSHFSKLPPVKDLAALYKSIRYILTIRELQTELLKGLFYSFPLEQESIQRIFIRWEESNFETIKEFAPYAYNCFEIEQFFYEGIFLNLIGTKSTNKVDLEYLFYLPFCNIFSSNDRFHKKIIKYFIKTDQSFVEGIDLKTDLTKIIEEERKLTKKEKEKFRKHTPRNPDTLTYKFWQKFEDWSPIKEKWVSKLEALEAKESKKIVERIKKLRNSKIDPNRKEFKDSEIDFIIKEKWIGPDDFCPCGSGKKFKDCHMSKIPNSPLT